MKETIARKQGEVILRFCWQIMSQGYIQLPPLVFLEQATLSTKPTALYESRVYPFVNALHFCTTFWMIAFGMLDVWHNRCIQLERRKR